MKKKNIPWTKSANEFLVCHQQSSRPWRSYPRGVEDAPAGSAHTASDAAHCRPDRFGHGVPGITALRPPRPGNPQLSGGRGPGGQDRRLWHVPRHLQHRLLPGEWLQRRRQDVMCCIGSPRNRISFLSALTVSDHANSLASSCPHLEISAAGATSTWQPTFLPPHDPYVPEQKPEPRSHFLFFCQL